MPKSRRTNRLKRERELVAAVRGDLLDADRERRGTSACTTSVTEWHLHEVMDRTSVILETFAEKVEQHKAVQADPAFAKQAARVTDALARFYQIAANKRLFT